MRQPQETKIQEMKTTDENSFFAGRTPGSFIARVKRAPSKHGVTVSRAVTPNSKQMLLKKLRQDPQRRPLEDRSNQNKAPKRKRQTPKFSPKATKQQACMTKPNLISPFKTAEAPASASPCYTLFTPENGTQMKHTVKIGPFYLYSADQTTTPSRVDLDRLSISDEAQRRLVAPEEKYMKMSFDNSNIEAVRAQNKARGGKRSISQNALMAAERSSAAKASATKIAELCLIRFNNQRFEWTHLIAHRFINEVKGETSAQVKQNLVIATKECNTMMMFFEGALTDLCKKIPKGEKITLNAWAKTVGDSHFASEIYYHVKIPALNIDLLVKFDATMTVKPTKEYEDAVHALFDYAADKKEPCHFGTPQPTGGKTKSRLTDEFDDHEATQPIASTLNMEI